MVVFLGQYKTSVTHHSHDIKKYLNFWEGNVGLFLWKKQYSPFRLIAATFDFQNGY